MKAIVLSGGGSKGAYQAGVLKHLLGNLKNQYEIICGVSVGAINSAFLAQYTLGNEIEASNKLSELWEKLENKNIYKRWFPLGKWHALWQPSLYNSQPLTDLIESTISLDRIRAAGRRVNVGTVSLSSGKYTIFNQTHPSFIKAVIASASFPIMLSPVKIADQLWSDGGSKEITPLKTAIDMGATEIDVIITSPEQRVKLFFENPNTIDVLKRSFDLSSDKIMSNDIEKVYIYNKLAASGDLERRVVKMNIFRPKNNLIEDVLDFTPSKVKIMMEKGYQDAITQVTI